MMQLEFIQGDCLEVMRRWPADKFDLVFGSPPYCDARTYGIDAQRNCVQWVDWMLEITEAAARICKGPVVWVAAGVTRKRNYWPACEGLMWEWWKRGGEHQLYRPCIFHRVGIPGSGGKDWFRADWEYVLCFKRPGPLPWSDNTACGHPPKWALGGEMSYRNSEGTRWNQWGGSDGTGEQLTGSVQKNGKRQRKGRPSHRLQRGNEKGAAASLPAVANPGNVVSLDYSTADVAALLDIYEQGSVAWIPVGGGVMGDAICHENEAPFPEKLVEIFVRSCCPPDGWCLDPFSGSGTTAKVCRDWGRNCVGVDLRESQVILAKKRVAQKLLI